MKPSPRFLDYDIISTFQSVARSKEFLFFNQEPEQSPDDLIKNVSSLLQVVKEDYFQPRNDAARNEYFVFAYEKFDSIYKQIYSLLQSSQKEDQDLNKGSHAHFLNENSSKAVLKDLFRCEQTIHRLIDYNTDEIVEDLVRLLEVLFDDYELLHSLLLLLLRKFQTRKEDAGPCQAKCIYFISPFVTLLHSGDINFFQVWQDRQNRQTSSTLVEKMLEKLVRDLKKNTDLSQEQIEALCKDIQDNSKSPLEERKRSLWKVCQAKEHFKRVELYYETLGQLSVLVHLWCLQEEDESIATAFFKMGLTTHVYAVQLSFIQTQRIDEYRGNYNYMVYDMNSSVQHELPVKVLQYVLDGLKKEKWHQHYLDVLELFMHSTFVLNSYITSKRYEDEYSFYKLAEKNIEPFFKEEISGQEEPGMWRQLFEFVRSSSSRLAQLSSSYLKDYSLYEAALLSWANTISTMFLVKYRMLEWRNEEYVMKPKYTHVYTAMFPPFLSLVSDNSAVKLITSSDIRREVIKAGTLIITVHKDFFKKETIIENLKKNEEDVLELVVKYQDQMKDSSKISEMKKYDQAQDSFSFFLYTLNTWITGYLAEHYNTTTDQNNAKELIQVLEFKPYKVFLSLFKDDGFSLTTISDPDELHAILSLVVTVLTIITTNKEFIEDAHNISCVKSMLKGVLSLDNALIKKETTIQLTSAIFKLIEKCSLFETWKDHKMLLLLFKFYLNSDAKFDWDDDYLLSSIYTQILKDSENTSWMLKFVELCIQKSEAQMKTRAFTLAESPREHWISVEEINCTVTVKNEDQHQPPKDPSTTKEQLEPIQVEKELEPDLTNKNLTKDPEITQIRFSVKLLKVCLGILNEASKGHKEHLPKINDAIKNLSRMVLLPAFIFNMQSRSDFDVIKGSFESFVYSQVKSYGPIIEGFCEGLTQLCDDFSLTQEQTYSDIDMIRLFKLVDNISCHEYLATAFIPKNFRPAEYAIIAVFLSFKMYRWCLPNSEAKSPFNLSPQFSDLLKKANTSLLKITSLMYKNMYTQLITVNFDHEPVDWESYSIKYVRARDAISDIIVKPWLQFFRNLARDKSLIPHLKLNLEELLERLEPNLEESSVRTDEQLAKLRIAYNLSIVNEFTAIEDTYFEDSIKTFSYQMILKSSILPKLIAFEIILVRESMKSDAKENDIVVISLRKLASVFNADNLKLEDEKAQHALLFDPKSGVILKETRQLIKDLSTEVTFIQDSSALKDNIVAVYNFTDKIYSLYSTYIDQQITNIDTKVANVSASSSAEEVKVPEEAKNPENDSKPTEQVQPDKKEPESPKAEKDDLLSTYKEHIQAYIDTCITNKLFISDMKSLIELGNKQQVVPRSYWIEEYEKTYKSMLCFLQSHLPEDNKDLQKRLQDEIDMIKTTVRTQKLSKKSSHASSMDTIISAWTFYSRINEFFTEDIASDLKLSQSFLESLLIVINTSLENVIDVKSCEGNKPFLESFFNLVNATTKLIKNFIIAHTSKNLGDLGKDNDKDPSSLKDILAWSMKMVELSLHIYDLILPIFEQSVLSSSQDWFNNILNLTTTILTADKRLEEPFTDNQILRKLLEMRKFNLCNEEGLTALLSLLHILFKNGIAGLKGGTKNKMNDLGPDDALKSTSPQALTPIAYKSLQTIVKALLKNYESDTESYMHNKQNMTIAKERTAKQDQKKRRILLNKNICINEDDTEDENKVNKFVDENVAFRETSLLVAALSSIMHTTPDLIPHVVFQKVTPQLLSSCIQQESSVWQFLQNQEKSYCLLDILMRVLLWRDVKSSLLIVGALFKKSSAAAFNNANNSIEKDEKTLDQPVPRFILLQRIFDIMDDMLNVQEISGKSLESLESTSMVHNISILIGYISKLAAEESVLKQEVTKLVTRTTEKLLQMSTQLALLIDKISPENTTIFDILSDIIKQNQTVHEALSNAEVKRCYVGILKTIDEEQNHPVGLGSDAKADFNGYIFDLKSQEEGEEEEKIDTTSDKKDSIGRKEKKTLLAIAGFKIAGQTVPQLTLPFGNDVKIVQDRSLYDVMYIFDPLPRYYKMYEKSRSGDYEERKCVFDLLEKLKDKNQLVQNLQSSYTQSIGYVQGTCLPGSLQPSKEALEALEKEQTESVQADSKDQTKKESSDQQTSTNEESSKKVSTDDNNPKEKEEGKEENEKKDDGTTEEVKFKYFITDKVENERRFKAKVNRLFKKGRNLKESVSLERALKSLLGEESHKLADEEMVQEYTKNMSRLDRSVTLLGLGKDVISHLSKEMQHELGEIEKEFKKIRENYSEYEQAITKASETKTVAKEEELKQGEDQLQKESAIVKEEDLNKPELDLKTPENIDNSLKEDKISNKEVQVENTKEQEQEQVDLVKKGADLNQGELKSMEESPEIKEEVTTTETRETIVLATDAVEREEDANRNVKIEEAAKEEEEESSDYDEFEYAFGDLDKEDKDKDEDDSSKDGDEEKPEVVIEEEDDLSRNASPLSKLKASSKRKEVSDKTRSTIRVFKLNDSAILSICQPLLTIYSEKYEWETSSATVVGSFLVGGVGSNPANALKVIDTLLFFIYTPDALQTSTGIDLPEGIRSYIKESGSSYNQDMAVKNLVSYFTKLLQDPEKSYIYFTPMQYLNKFGNKLLDTAKSQTMYHAKIAQSHSIADAIVGLLGMKHIIKDKLHVEVFIRSIRTLMQHTKKIEWMKDDYELKSLDEYKKVMSWKNLSAVLSSLDSELVNTEGLVTWIEDLLISLKRYPSLFPWLKEHLLHNFLSLFPAINETLEASIKQLRVFEENKNTATDLTEIITKLSGPQLQSIKISISSFANIFYYYLISDEIKDNKEAENILSILQSMLADHLGQVEISTLILNMYEVIDLAQKARNTLGLQDRPFEAPLLDLVSICLFHYSIVIMPSKYTAKHKNKAYSRGASNSDSLPTLARLVSYDDKEVDAKKFTQLQRTFSQYKSHNDFDFESIFANFALKNSKVISQLCLSANDENKTSLNNILSLLVPICPWMLDLKTKRQIINKKNEMRMKELGIEQWEQKEYTIDREHFLRSTVKQFKSASNKDLLKRLRVSYKGEEGIDAGGLRREFISLIVKELFDPNLGLFQLSSNHLSVQPNLSASIVPNYLFYFQLCGIIIAKAVQGDLVVECSFTRSFLKHILKKEITISDIEDVDAELGKNLKWMLDNSVDDLYLTFTHEAEILNQRAVIELCEGGADIFIDDVNKKDYVKKVCEARMTKQIEAQTKAFLKGFYTILPHSFISHLSTSELEMIISGVPKIDLDEMKKHVELIGYTKTSPIIVWFWEVMEEFSQKELADFLYFVSGSLKVSYGGFKEHPVRIAQASENEGLPVGHTCFYQIDLPDYDGKDKLRAKLLIALFDGIGGFYIG